MCSAALSTQVTSPARIVRVVLDVPLDRQFDYLNPGLDIREGNRVVVPFAGRQLIGIVMALPAQSDVPEHKLKAVIQGFEDVPFDAATLKLLRFCADYYHYPFGQTVLSSLPLRLRQTKPAVSRKMWVYALAQPVPEDLVGKRQLILSKLITVLQQHKECSERLLAEVSSGWRKAIQPLLETGLVSRREVLAIRPSLPASDHEPVLNEEQAHAVNCIVKDLSRFQPWLLFGVTGSGKTEVYIRLLQAVLAEPESQVLIMVPEINLTPQLEGRFRSRLSQFPLVTLHSHLSESERLQHWQAAQSGEARIVIGTRLSVFTPMPHLKLMILDEEHDSSYKQQDGMRYHARDVALVRAKQCGIPVVLGSATPSLESWYNAIGDVEKSKHPNKKPSYRLLTLNHRAAAQAQLPRIFCVDTTHSPPEAGLTPQLKQAITQRLERGEQSLLFINRRGYAPVLHCSACQWLADCRRCSAKVVLHLRQRLLRCHHCGDEQPVPLQCPSCGNPDLRPVGQATQRVEETLQQLFPQARIARVDKDTIQGKDALTEVLSAVHAGKIDILIGTQMLAKGHDFANLTLVGVLDTDSALYSPDYRASERLFAQLMQVSGRAGRGDKPGEVLIQTAFPQHPLFGALQQQNYAEFADSLLQERITLQFPPAAYIAVMKAEAADYALVEQFLTDLTLSAREFIAQQGGVLSEKPVIYDPVRPVIARLNRMERGYVMMQCTQRNPIQQLLHAAVAWARQHPLQAKIRWVVDVDALDY
ncbi:MULTISPECIES: primosomal protein N' [unclassified Methylophilus]|uniref:primosomal protein N' n=1 Tax=unclassified Methylophilus TaxID=2630143 RepID=UPI0006FCB7B9|nr:MULTISPECIES: primosomal protein N' [unclassified Methylophilus]KQT41413.1 primosomal protein N' [Methylophilus sp. Leaf416]KQT57934.1 primosomal protein N' [Methylophilus sp. Leaf459]